MYPSLFIFAIAFIVRLLNLYLNQINVDTYLIEDQIMYWDWSLENAYTPYNSIEPKTPSHTIEHSFPLLLTPRKTFTVRQRTHRSLHRANSMAIKF